MKGPFPDSFTSKMPINERPKGWMSGVDAQEKFAAGAERKLQNLIANYLSLHDIYFEQDRMDKRTRGKVGRPDFRICYRGRFVAIECKTQAGKLSREQTLEMARIRDNGGSAHLVLCLEDLQRILIRIDAEIRVIKDAMQIGGWREKNA